MRAVFILDACHFFPQCMLAIIALIGGVTDVVVTIACPFFALWLSLPCQGQGQGQGLLLSCWDRGPRSVTELCFCSVVQGWWD